MDNATPDVGSDVVFTLTLANAADFSEATDVVVSDALPAGYSFVSAAGDGAYDSGAGTWTVASIPAASSANVAITATVLGAGSYTNVAEVVSAGTPDTDDTYADGAGEEFASASTVPNPVVDLTLTKDVDNATPAVGVDVVFTLTLTNTANFSDASNIVVTDALPSGYSFVSASGDGVYVDAAGTWTIATLSAGESATLDVTATVLGAGAYLNAAEVTAADQPDTDDTYGDASGNDAATAGTTPVATVDLSLTNSVDNATPDVGANVTFTVTVSNAAGFSDASNLMARDLIPSGYRFVSATGDGTYVDATGAWSIPAIAAGASATLDITMTVLGVGSYLNAAEVINADQPDADDTFGDGAGSDHATASTTPNAIVDFSLTKTVDNPTPIVGRDVVFSITLTNAIDYSPATGVVVRDLLPAGYRFVSAAGDGSYVDTTGDWNVGNLAQGATANLQITATVLGSGPYLNQAEVATADQPDTDDTYLDGAGEDRDQVSTAPAPTADLTLSIDVDNATPDVGQAVVFTMLLSNAVGFSDATNVVVTGPVPTGYRFVSGSGDGVFDDAAGTWALGAVAAGSTATMNVTATVLGAGGYLNVAEVSSADQPDTLDTYSDGAGDDYAEVATTPNAVTNLTLTKIVDHASPNVGSNVLFTLTLSADADFSDATGIVVSDPLPSGYTFVSSAGDGAYDSATGDWTIPSLAGGSNAALSITATVLGAGSYDNIAEVMSADQPDSDDVYADGLGADRANAATAPTPIIDLSLAKRVDQPTPGVGDNVTFTLTLTNASGFSPGTNVVVTENLPTGYTFVSASGDGLYDPGAGTWTVPAIASGTNATIDIVATVLGTGVYLNEAEVASADQVDHDDTFADGAGADRASVGTTPVAMADLSLTFDVDVTDPPVGTDVVFYRRRVERRRL